MGRRKKPSDERIIKRRAAFGAELRAVLDQAEPPITYRWLEHQASEQRGVPLPKATLSRVITGQSRPHWAMVEQVLRLCGIPDSEIRGVWKPKWSVLITEISKLEKGMPSVETKDTPMCDRCGAMVLDHDLHDDHHAQLEALARRGRLRLAG